MLTAFCDKRDARCWWRGHFAPGIDAGQEINADNGFCKPEDKRRSQLVSGRRGEGYQEFAPPSVMSRAAIFKYSFPK
jgi:hypothetical protein